jgi:hypothetical protein
MTAILEGPPAAARPIVRENLADDFDRNRAWLAAHGAEAGVPSEDLALIAAVDRDAYVAAALDRYVLAYRSRAVFGLALVADDAGMTLLRALANDPASALQQAAQAALGGSNGGGDRMPPVTQAGLTGPAGKSGWYVGPVTFALQASDVGSGVAATHYRVDAGPLLTYSSPVVVAGDGIHQATFFSVDAAGNQESAGSLLIRIDSTGPIGTLRSNTATLWPPNGALLPVSFTGTLADPTSGIDAGSVRFTVRDTMGRLSPSGAVTPRGDGTFAFTVTLEARRDGNSATGRTFTIEVTATDVAGNVSTSGVMVTVPHDRGR